jgi:hypothetical protein
MMEKEPQTDKLVVQIKLAFLGATRNLCLLENKLIEIESISLYQYTNYLSQLGLCIELGLKSIISNSKKFECIHDLKRLFLDTPKAFQQKFKEGYSEEFFESNIANITKMFADFRYMELDSTLNEYFDESTINSDGTINLKKTTDLVEFQFPRLLLEEILEYEESIREETIKKMQSIEFPDADVCITQYIELLKNNQR